MTLPEAIQDVVMGSGIGALTALAILGLRELTKRRRRRHNRVRCSGGGRWHANRS